MVCDVCHFKKEKLPAFSFDWKETENADFSGKPFGTFYNPKTKTAHKDAHYISRIAIFVKNNGKKQLTVNGVETRKATAYLQKEKTPNAWIIFTGILPRKKSVWPVTNAIRSIASLILKSSASMKYRPTTL